MIKETNDFLSLIEEQSKDARDILLSTVFTKRKLSQFEHFIQLFCSAFDAKRSSLRDFHDLRNFTSELAGKETTIASRLELFVLCASLLKQFPDRKPPIESTLIKKLRDNRGCLEYDCSSSSIGIHSSLSSTLFGFEPNYPSSSLLPSQFNSQNAILDFKSRLRDLYVREAKLDIGLENFAQSLWNERDFENFMFELYSNIVDHGRLDFQETTQSSFPLQATFWYLRFERFAVPASGITSIFPKTSSYMSYTKYISKVRKNKPKLFVSVSLYDNGRGILDHYAVGKGLSGVVPKDFRLFSEVLLEQRTTKKRPGAGHGIKTAFECIGRLHGFVSIRSNRFWATKQPFNEGIKNEVDNKRTMGDYVGTLYSITLPVW
jgi:hypothetical protein